MGFFRFSLVFDRKFVIMFSPVKFIMGFAVRSHGEPGAIPRGALSRII